MYKSKYVKSIASTISENKKIIPLLFIVFILVESFSFRVSSDIVFFGILALYVLYIKALRVKSVLTYQIALGILCGLCISFIISYGSPVTEKLTVWLFLFLSIGIVQGWKE